MNEIVITRAAPSDLSAIKRIADRHKTELGFVLRPVLEAAITRAELIVAKREEAVIGFCHYHRCRDGWTTIYEIVSDRKRIGVGRALLDSIIKPFRLKATIDNPANAFYKHMGGIMTGTHPGRKRALALWCFFDDKDLLADRS